MQLKSRLKNSRNPISICVYLQFQQQQKSLQNAPHIPNVIYQSICGIVGRWGRILLPHRFQLFLIVAVWGDRLIVNQWAVGTHPPPLLTP